MMFGVWVRKRSGFAVSIELVLVVAVVFIGLAVAFSAMRDAVVSELADLAGAVGDNNQSFAYNGATGGSASTAGSGHSDATDSTETSVDGISFDLLPSDEDGGDDGGDDGGGDDGGGDDGGGDTSAVGTFSFDPFALGGSATGTIGDGTIDTGFSVSGSDPNLILGTSDNLVSFSEQPGDTGSITTTFDDPLTEVEVFFSSVTNDGDPHLIGNFTLVLSDGTTINNAGFQVVADTISPNVSLGPFFTTSSKDTSLLSTTTVGGNQFVTDGTNDGGGIGDRQAAGRLTFTDAAVTGAPAGVGISSITFERSGGEDDFSAVFSVSGSVNQ